MENIFDSNNHWTEFLEIMRDVQSHGAYMLVKVDGERDKNIFSIVIGGGKVLGHDNVRTETDDLMVGLRKVFCEFNEIINESE